LLSPLSYPDYSGGSAALSKIYACGVCIPESLLYTMWYKNATFEHVPQPRKIT